MPLQYRFVLHTMWVLPLLAGCRAAALACGRGKRRRTSPAHEAGVLVFWAYLCVVGYFTVNIARVLRGHFELGGNYNLTPLAEITGIAASGDRVYALLNIAGNVLLFMPLGVLLPLLWRGWTGARVLLVSALLSGAIEVLQLFTGRSADIDDVILNTAGGVAGYLGYRVAVLFCPALNEAFRLLARPGRREAAQGRQEAVGAHRAVRKRAARRRAVLVSGVVLCMLAGSAALFGRLLDRPVPAGGNPPGLQRQEERPGGRAEPGAKWDAQEEAPLLWVELPPVHSRNLLLVSGATGEVICGSGEGERIYPASLTKMMTVLLALERIGDLQEMVVLREEIYADIYAHNLATAGFLPGEEVAAIDLVYGAMLPSGAECAAGLAEHVAGSEAAFVALMNERAAELGMTDTQFQNSTGAHHPGHYTTAADLARLMRYALEDERFRAVMATERYSTGAASMHPDGITFASTLFGRAEGVRFAGGAIGGGKTGYTDEAGQCLASFAEIGGERYILITAGARPQDFREQQLHIEDALTVYGALGEALLLLAGVR